jgi:NAD-dependent deacetylase
MNIGKDATRLPETVVEVGCEGGSITLLRKRGAGEAWKFRLGINEVALYDMLSEEDLAGLGPAVKESGYVHSFPEALGLLDQYQWFKLVPLEVHPEYLDAVLLAVRDRGGPERAASWLVNFATSVAVLTGAGTSAESGIPTFRSDGGYWRTHRFQDLATPEGFARDPELVWSWYEGRRRSIALAKPNAGHYALCRIEDAKPVFTLITQNVDGLHDLAGSRSVIKLHGDIWTTRCLKCGEERIDRSQLDELPPHCHCGGMLRPGVVWFGEALPRDAMQRAEKAVRSADVLIVAGTSAQVYPAAGLISMAKAVIEINPEVTPFSDSVTFSLRGTSAKILPLLLEHNSTAIEDYLTEQRYLEATNPFRKAAEQGDVRAMVNLSRTLFSQYNYADAYMWMNVAAKNLEGTEREAACRERDVVGSWMSPEELADAQGRASGGGVE